ncbi:class F sortase [Streptomyces sp. NPDC049881]|uniref:class F sortase n=1 Tax=unclassified Streptomyces TaxID=2593676 RepID=UPI00343D3D17
MRIPEYVPDPADERRGWTVHAVLGTTGAALVLGVSLVLAPGGGGGAAAGPPPQPSGAAGRGADVPGAVLEPLPPAVPTWVSVPAIGVDAPLTPVGLEPDGWIESPPEDVPGLAGWYRDGAAPGADGTAVVVGHVDNAAGPAVFYGLGALNPGDRVEVVREDGRAVGFTVYDIAVYDKADLPAHVFRATGQAELRLLTCGGGFDEDSGYTGNVVVFARMSDAT